MKNAMQFLLLFAALLLINQNSINAATKTWTGSGAGGSGTDFNDGLNWSGGVAPSSGDDAVIPVNAIGTVFITGNITIRSLQINFTSAIAGVFTFTVNTGKAFSSLGDIIITNQSATSFVSQFQLSVSSLATITCNNFTSNCNGLVSLAQNYIINQGDFTINGNLLINGNTTMASTKTYIVNYKNFSVNGNTATALSGGSNTIFIGTEDGGITSFNGSVDINGSSSTDSVGFAGKGLLGVRDNSSGQVIFRGDLTLGIRVKMVKIGTSSTTYTLPDLFIFDLFAGTQTIYDNSSSQIYFPNLQIGILNSPIVNLSGSNNLQVYLGNIIVNNTAILDLAAHTLNRSDPGGMFTLNNTATLKLGGSSGGQAGSNFPKNFSSISLNSGSLVEYNGSSLNQTIYPTGTAPNFSYGNLKLSNGGTKTVGNACPSISGTVYITGATTTVDDGGHTFGQSSTNLTQDGGRFRMSSAGTKPDMNGTYSLTNGVIEYANINSTLQTIRSKSYQNIEVTGSRVGNSSGNITLNNNGKFTVKPGGVFSINDNTITCLGGNGTVILENNSLFKTGNDKGFSGFFATFSSNSAIHSNITNVVLATGSTVEYTRSTAQVFSARINYSNVTISGAGAKSMNGDAIISGALSNGLGNQLVLNNYTLTANGSVAGAGTLTGSRKSGLIFGLNATANGLKLTKNDFTHSFPDSVNNYLDTLILSTGAQVTLGDSLNITGSNGLPLLAGHSDFGKTRGYLRVDNNAILTSAGYLTLRSDKYGDAYIAPTAGTISGIVRYDRFFYARRAWRMISMPFRTSPQSINAAWQESHIDYALSCPPQDQGTLGFGTGISYNNNSAVGYDQHNNNYKPSIQVWESNKWNALNNTKGTLYTNLMDYRAYSLFVRGDRAVCQTYNAMPRQTVLRSNGILSEDGSVTGNSVTESFIAATGSNQYVLIGNPFPAPVKFTGANSVQYSGFNTNTFWFFDPGLTGNGVGAYVIYSNAIPTGWLIPSDPNNPNGVYTGNENPFVQSGQAYLMQTNGTSTNPTALFSQNNKGDNQFNVTGPFSLKQTDPEKKAAVYVYLRSTTDSMAVTDAVAVAVSDRYLRGLDEYDAPKPAWNDGENMFIKNDTNSLMIDARPAPLLTDTVFLKLYLYNTRQYALQVFGINSPYSGFRMWLVDSYLGTKINILPTDTLLYHFAPDTDTNSYRNRFMIIFNRQLSTTPLPLAKTANQKDPNTTGIGNSIGISIAAAVSLQPNPVKLPNNAILCFNNIAKGYYKITVYDYKGQKLAMKQINHDGSNKYYTLPKNISWSSGIYLVSINDLDTKITITLKLIVIK